MAPSHERISAWQLRDGAGFVARAALALRALFAVAKDPGHVLAGPALNLSMDKEIYARHAARLASTEGGREFLRQRPAVLRGPGDLPWLHSQPAGSLGRELALYYDRGGIAPFESTYPVRSDVEYLARRYRELHDAAHVLTGYGTDPIGELELQAFVFGNAGLRNPLLVLVLGPLLRPAGLPPIWRSLPRLRAAFRRGRRSDDVVVAARVESCWALPLEQARRAVGLAPC